MGHNYGFYCVAIDNAGNRQATPATAQATTSISVVNSATSTALTVTANATTGGTLVTLKATVTATAPNASVPTGVVQFLDGASAIGSQAIDAMGVATLQVLISAAGNHSVTAQYGGATGFLPSTSNSQSVVVSLPPEVVSVTLNGNIPSLLASNKVQHSRIASVVIVFNTAVQLDANAVTLTLCTKNVSFGGVNFPNGYGSVPTSLDLSTTDNITWTVTFSGNTEIIGSDGFASLKDGVYDFKIDATKVHRSGSPTVTMTANSTTTFHRLYGDIDSPGTPAGGAPNVDFSAVVNTGDNLAFRAAFNRPAPDYKAYLDFDGDGSIINTGDNFQFRQRFNKTLTWRA
jgi:hypothetical protein